MHLAQTSKQPFGGKVYKAAKGHQPIDSDWPEDCDHFAIDWIGPYSRARTTVLLMFKVMSNSCLQLPGKWFEALGCTQDITL